MSQEKGSCLDSERHHGDAGSSGCAGMRLSSFCFHLQSQIAVSVVFLQFPVLLVPLFPHCRCFFLFFFLHPASAAASSSRGRHHQHNIINTSPSTQHHQHITITINTQHHQQHNINTTPSTQHHLHSTISTWSSFAWQHLEHLHRGRRKSGDE